MTTAPRVLLCDAAFGAMPLLAALQLQGCEVSVCGARASDPCHALADHSFLLDYSDIEALQELVQQQGFDYIVPGCTDVSYLASSAVARALKLPGYDNETATLLIHEKQKFRQFARQKGYPIPHATNDIGEAAGMAFPLLVKPVDSYSGKGITHVATASGLASAALAARAHSRSGQVLFEEFKQGDLYSHSAFLRGGSILVDFFVNEYCTVYPYQVNSSNVATQLSASVQGQMRAWLEQFARDAQLCDGLLHTQFLVDGDQIWLIESARRCPGDLYCTLIEMATGVDYPAHYVAGFCARTLPSIGSRACISPVSRHTISVAEKCVYVSASIALPAQRTHFVPLKKTGDMLEAAPLDRAGIYFIVHDSVESMEHNTKRLAQLVKVNDLHQARNLAG